MFGANSSIHYTFDKKDDLLKDLFLNYKGIIEQKAEKRFFSFIAKDADSNKHTCFVFLSDKLVSPKQICFLLANFFKKVLSPEFPELDSLIRKLRV